MTVAPLQDLAGRSELLVRGPWHPEGIDVVLVGRGDAATDGFCIMSPKRLTFEQPGDIARLKGLAYTARGSHAEEAMNARRHTKFVREGSYAAEVDVELLEEDNGWSPYLSLDDARKLDAVREALRRGDLEAASRLARVFIDMCISNRH